MRNFFFLEDIYIQKKKTHSHAMKQNTKDWIQYLSAIAMLLSAIGLALWSFQTLNQVHSTVLGYVGEAIAFAAAVYGLALYAKNEIQKEMKLWVKENNKPRRKRTKDEEEEIEE